MKIHNDTKQITENVTNDRWSKLASHESIKKTIEALKKNGINAELAVNKNDARKKALALIPDRAEVMNMTSVTLDETGISK